MTNAGDVDLLPTRPPPGVFSAGLAAVVESREYTGPSLTPDFTRS